MVHLSCAMRAGASDTSMGATKNLARNCGSDLNLVGSSECVAKRTAPTDFLKNVACVH